MVDVHPYSDDETTARFLRCFDKDARDFPRGTHPLVRPFCGWVAARHTGAVFQSVDVIWPFDTRAQYTVRSCGLHHRARSNQPQRRSGRPRAFLRPQKHGTPDSETWFRNPSSPPPASSRCLVFSRHNRTVGRSRLRETRSHLHRGRYGAEREVRSTEGPCHNAAAQGIRRNRVRTSLHISN
ncbi:MAG: hypothetical protein BWY06_03417 [Candidatus Latescibacteria bacterium ADurb.Bin168]|nr:MAG: hypothetical protein BWY06_03417 [Candidatus Latescibacteria bacterium ADurb.Bin168]